MELTARAELRVLLNCGLLVILGLVLGESEAALQGRRKSGNEVGRKQVGGDVEEVDEHSVLVSETRGWNGSVAVMTHHSTAHSLSFKIAWSYP